MELKGEGKLKKLVLGKVASSRHAGVAKLVDAPDLGSGLLTRGVGSNPISRTMFPCSSVVEWVTVNHLTLVRVQAREPAAGSSKVEHHSDKVVVEGSSPSLPTITKVCRLVVGLRSPKPSTRVRILAGLPMKEEQCW